MKKMKGFRKVLAGLLVLCMFMGYGAGVSESNDGGVSVFDAQNQKEWSSSDVDSSTTLDKVVSYIQVSGDGDNYTEEISVGVQGISRTDVGPGVLVEDNTDTVSITTKSDTGIEAGVGIHVEDNHGTVDIDTSKISLSINSFQVDSNNGTINLNKPADENDNKQGADLEGGWLGVYIAENDKDIYLNTNSITGTAEDGIHVGSTNPAYPDKNTENNGDITIIANSVNGGRDGIAIENNAGSISITENKVTGGNEGIEIENNTAKGSITLNTGDIQGNAGNGIEIENNAGTISQNQNLGENQNPGNVTGGDNGINIESNSGEINLTENNVTGTNGDGIHIGYTDTTNSANNKGNTGTITITADVVSGTTNGIEIENNAADGTVTLNANKINNYTAGGTATQSANENDDERNGALIKNNQGTVNLNRIDNDELSTVTGSDFGINIKGNDGKIHVDTGYINGSTNAMTITGSTANSEIKVQAWTIANYESTGGYAINLERNKGTISVDLVENPINESSLDPAVITGEGGGIYILENQANVDITAKKIEATTAGQYAVCVVNSFPGSVINLTADEIDVNDGKGTAFHLTDAAGKTNLTANSVNGGIWVSTEAIHTDENVTFVADVAEGANGGVMVDSVAEKNTTDVTVKGNVTQEDRSALRLSGSGNKDILIDGTLSGKTAIQLMDDDAAESTTLAVWKAESTGVDKALVTGSDNAKTFESAIRYIAKVADSAAGLLSVQGTKSKTVTFGTGEKAVTQVYQTAKNGEDVTVTLDEDYGLESVYYYYDDETKTGKGQMTVGNGLTAVANAINTFTLKMLDGGMLLGLTSHKHDYSVFVKEVKAPTCTEAGANLYKCAHCEATKQVAVAAKGHSPAAAVKENEKAAQVGVAGSYDSVVYCSACGAELSRTTVTIDPLPEPEKPEDKSEDQSEDQSKDQPEDKQEDKKEKKEEESKPAEKKDESGQKTETEESKSADKKDESGQKTKTEESKPAEKKDESGQQAAGQAANNTANTEIRFYNTSPATQETVLAIRSNDDEHQAELIFLSNGSYQIKSPKGGESGSFALSDGQIVLTSETGRKMNIKEDGILAYAIGDGIYEFKFGSADLEMLAAAVK